MLKDISRALILGLIIFGVVILVLNITGRIKSPAYQFTTLKVSANNSEKKLVWVSKIKNVDHCEESALYKKLVNPDWSVVDSSCVNGKTRVSDFISADYNEWLKAHCDLATD